MKRNFWYINPRSLLRAAVVGLASLVVCIVVGGLVGSLLNALYFTSGFSASFWQEVFVFFSQYRILIAIVVCACGLALFSGWILTPAFNRLGDSVTACLRLDGNDTAPPPQFPRGLQPLEAALERTGQELRLWKYAVREAEQRKDDLVMYLAHDIRTPLTSVLGYLELLDESPDLPEASRQKYIAVALRKAGRMQTLVEELFETARYNVGRIELTRRPVNLDVLVRQLVEELTPAVRERNIRLSVENRGVGTMNVDADKLARAVDNVLHNAAHYTPEGGEIGLLLEPTGAGHARLLISNTGASIPQEKLERFFERFYRADEARQSGSGGSGLGLAIAKSIVEAHGGSISAHNENAITTFTIML